MPDISILIAHIPSRRISLNRLLLSLFTQIKNNALWDRVEIIILEDEFQVTIGCKRNMLLDMATGKFVMFVDDDDEVHEDFCNIVCNIIKNKDIDYIGSKLKRSFSNLPEYRSITLGAKHQDEFGSYRAISHTTPIKRSIASLFKFPDISHGEDEEWCEKIRASNIIEKEYFCLESLYHQNFTNQKDYEKTDVSIVDGPAIYKHIIDFIS